MITSTERVVEAHAVYEKAEFLQRTNLKQAGWRSARRNGLRVAEIHGRCYVKGSDWHDYLAAQIDDPGQSAASVLT